VDAIVTEFSTARWAALHRDRGIEHSINLLRPSPAMPFAVATSGLPAWFLRILLGLSFRKGSSLTFARTFRGVETSAKLGVLSLEILDAPIQFPAPRALAVLRISLSTSHASVIGRVDNGLEMFSERSGESVRHGSPLSSPAPDGVVGGPHAWGAPEERCHESQPRCFRSS
jgi:hypothetical protein